MNDTWLQIRDLYRNNGFFEAAANLRDIMRQWDSHEDQLLSLLKKFFHARLN